VTGQRKTRRTSRYVVTTVPLCAVRTAMQQLNACFHTRAQGCMQHVHHCTPPPGVALSSSVTCLCERQDGSPSVGTPPPPHTHTHHRDNSLHTHVTFAPESGLPPHICKASDLKQLQKGSGKCSFLAPREGGGDNSTGQKATQTRQHTVQYSTCGRGSQTSAPASEPRAHEGAHTVNAVAKHTNSTVLCCCA
jgi:hypothetical protein